MTLLSIPIILHLHRNLSPFSWVAHSDTIIAWIWHDRMCHWQPVPWCQFFIHLRLLRNTLSSVIVYGFWIVFLVATMRHQRLRPILIRMRILPPSFLQRKLYCIGFEFLDNYVAASLSNLRPLKLFLSFLQIHLLEVVHIVQLAVGVLHLLFPYPRKSRQCDVWLDLLELDIPRLLQFVPILRGDFG